MNDRRRYSLPGVEDLTKEQEVIVALPMTGRHLVVGGPGTGKTVICLLRARRLARRGKDYRFLVWNHLLHRASRALFKGELQAETWNSWFWGVFRETFGREPPLLPSENSWKPVDWKAVDRAVGELPESSHEGPRPFLVIDEGQDMPPGFYDFLLQLGFENLLVAADQNQQIKEDEHSSRRELEDLLGGNARELTYNHRNSFPVARLAREFATDDPASPLPEFPAGRRTVDTPRLYTVGDRDRSRIARSILRHWDQDPRRLIGVIAPNDIVRRGYHDALKASASEVPLDHGSPGSPWIKSFHGDNRFEVPFDRGGILVINAQACKGLEFDTAVLADIDEHRLDAVDPDRAKKLFYVMVSRARERVVLFMKRSGDGRIETILPQDETVLRRRDLRDLAS